MKVAFASTTGERIDEHFGMARTFHIWDVGPQTANFLACVSAVPGDGDDEEDKIAARADAIASCAIVYTVQIGGPAAAKLVARRIHPIKTRAGLPVLEAVGKLQEVLNGNPPPWLRKAMDTGTAASFRKAD